MSSRPRRRRTAGREAKRAARQQAPTSTAAFIERKIPYVEVLNEEALELIEHNAETVLEEIGIEFKEFPRALALFKDAGADVDGERVRVVGEAVADRPAPERPSKKELCEKPRVFFPHSDIPTARQNVRYWG